MDRYMQVHKANQTNQKEPHEDREKIVHVCIANHYISNVTVNPLQFAHLNVFSVQFTILFACDCPRRSAVSILFLPPRRRLRLRLPAVLLNIDWLCRCC